MRQLSLFKGKRQKGERLPAPLEFNTHVMIADLCRRWIDPAWQFTHLPMGEKRDIITAARLKRMGVMAGWPDFMFLGPSRQLFFLELKRRGSGRLSEGQADVVAHIARCGFPILITDSVDEAIATLKDLGILPSKIKVQ